MTAADDVAEMQELCEYISASRSKSTNIQAMTSALHKAFNPNLRRGDERISWNRCYEFLKAKARLVQSWEKDLARAEAKAIRAAERERKTTEHIEWLRSIHERAAETGADMDRADLAVVERVLTRIGALDSAVGSPRAAEDEDQSKGWGL
jgi:hypothetical protein